MPETTSPLSYQTVMPSYPDVSYQTWKNKYAGRAVSRLGADIFAWSQGSPNYQTWRQNLLDEYNAGVGAYNAWASSPQGNRAQREEAGYNVNYDSGQVSSGSPLSYQDSNPGNGFSEMAQGAQGILSLASALMNFKIKMANVAMDLATKKEQVSAIKSQVAKNNAETDWIVKSTPGRLLGLEIGNKWNPLLNKERVGSLRIANQWNPLLAGRKYDLLGYESDALEMENAKELYSRFGDIGSYVSGSGSAYNLSNVNRGLGYQRAFQDIQSLKASRKLTEEQAKVAQFTAKEKEFYVNSIQDVYKQFLETQLGLAKGQLSFQSVEQDIRRKAFKWNVGLGVANTTISAVKTAFGLFNPMGRALNAFGPQSIAPDIADYGAYGSY